MVILIDDKHEENLFRAIHEFLSRRKAGKGKAGKGESREGERQEQQRRCGCNA